MSEKPYDPPATTDESGGPTPKRFLKPLLLVIVVAVFAGLIYQFGDSLSLESLAQRETQLREFQANNPYLVYGIAFLVYVVATGLSLPGAAPLTLVYAWYFTFWPALVLISFASTIGATIAFLMSRYFAGQSVQAKFGDRLASFNEHLDRDGAFYLFTLRLIPAVPFFVINLVMGLTKLKATTYYWVSQLGMLPGTAVYVYAGSRVPDLNTLAKDGIGSVFSPTQLTQIFVAFALLGLFPLVTKKLLAYFAKPKQ